jgi:hypothetical protein
VLRRLCSEVFRAFPRSKIIIRVEAPDIAFFLVPSFVAEKCGLDRDCCYS